MDDHRSIRNDILHQSFMVTVHLSWNSLAWSFCLLFSLIYKATDQGLRIIKHLTKQIEGNNKLDRINGTNYYWFNKGNYGDDS